MRAIVLLSIAALISICAPAQVTQWSDSDIVLNAPEAWDINFDELLNSWYIKHYTKRTDNEVYKEFIPVSDSVYVERLSKLPNVIELPYNDAVRSCIDFYVERRRNLVEYMLGLEAFYFPMIEETLDRYGLPAELKYLTIVESALNPVALSRKGASGLWQFMLPTGKFYGLEVNSLIDERRDPVKSTEAACSFLKDLYNTYEDWTLAIAAYNCGGGNVNKAIKRSGGKKDYWAIYPYLPKETRTYIPFFIAANYVMNYYAHHQLYPIQTTLPLSTDTVIINKLIHLDQIAEVLQIDKEEIRALNPQYKKDIIPGNYKQMILKLPSVKAYAFIELEAKVLEYKANELLPNRTYAGEISTHNQKRITHKVEKNETLASVGDLYGVKIADIRKWNSLKSNKLSAGRNLVLYVGGGDYSTKSQAKTASADQPQRPPKAAVTSAPTKETAPASNVETAQYKVKSGDSFYTIAQKYPGFSHTDLMKLNNMTKPALKVGQYIKVPKI